MDPIGIIIGGNGISNTRIACKDQMASSNGSSRFVCVSGAIEAVSQDKMRSGDNSTFELASFVRVA